VALRTDLRIGYQTEAEAQELERRCLPGTATADQAVQPIGELELDPGEEAAVIRSPSTA
jgi:hypothetical protein